MITKCHPYNARRNFKKFSVIVAAGFMIYLIQTQEVRPQDVTNPCFPLRVAAYAESCQSIRFLTSEINIRPNADQYVQRGAIWHGIREVRRAMQDYDEAIRVSPRFVQAHYMRGLLNEDTGDLVLALTDLRNAVRMDPEHTDAGRALSRVERRIDALDTARRRLGAGREGETLFAGQQQTNPRSAENTPARLQEQAQRQNASGGSPAVAAHLTQGEARGLAEQIGECWSVDAGMLGLQDIVVELRVQLDERCNVRNVVPGDRGVPSDPRGFAVYQSARRALLSPQCNPLRVPPDKHRTVMESTFRFNPGGLVR